MRPPERERGAALLTVLLLVAVISVIAAGALERLRIATAVAANAAATDQARAFAYAAETLATTRVSDLLGRSRDRVTLAGGWSGRPFTLPLPGGVATARVVDGTNCFNLNGLVQQAGTTLVPRPSVAAQFARLMRLLQVPAGEADRIAASATDWIDGDQSPLPGGAEDETYARRPTPYRTANAPMVDVSELRAVEGVTPAIFATLRPWLCTLPVAQPSAINVNTLLPEQAPLVAMLTDSLSVAVAQQVLLRRPAPGWESANAFQNDLTRAGSGGGIEGLAQTAVTSKWFALRIDVSLGNAQLREAALIDARRLPARLVSRNWGDDS